MKRAIALTVAVSGAAILLTSALGAYGPPPATHPDAPGGYSRVLASATIGPSGGTLRARVGAVNVALVVPRGILQIPLQFALRGANLQLLRRHVARQNLKGTVLMGVAVSGAKLDGTLVRGRFSDRPVEFVLRGRRLSEGDRLIHWSSGLDRFTFVALSSRLDGEAQGMAIRFTRGQELAVIRPSR
jgi:hypothetical protein